MAPIDNGRALLGCVSRVADPAPSPGFDPRLTVAFVERGVNRMNRRPEVSREAPRIEQIVELLHRQLGGFASGMP